MKKTYIKVLFFANILIGGALVIYQQSLGMSKNPYLSIIGFVMLMFGLYGVSRKMINSNRTLYKEGDFDEIPFKEKKEELEDE